MVFTVALIPGALPVGFGRLVYNHHIKSEPVRAATAAAVVKPMTAPRGPRPMITSEMIRMVLMMAWMTTVMLFSSIFSMPMNAAVAVLNNAVVKIVNAAI